MATSQGNIGRCCRQCFDGETFFPHHCSCLCHERVKAAKEALVKREASLAANFDAHKEE